MIILLLIPVIGAVILLKTHAGLFPSGQKSDEENTVRLFLCGDVMTGRGIDQILDHPGDPVIHESYMKSAVGYVRLAEKVNGKIPYPVAPDYIWGEAIHFWEHLKPDVKIINLETSITSCDDPWPDKAVNYRMHPENIDCLLKPGIHYCALANNHLLDYGWKGMTQTMEVLQKAGITFSGCGETLREARKPAIITLPDKGRLLLFSIGLVTSGIPHAWAAEKEKGGVYLPFTHQEILDYLQSYLKENRQPDDVVVLSIHWGSNWGYDIPPNQLNLAHRLIEEGGVDVIHGHSSHHFKGIEIHRDKPIIYGAGDFINDYEGIGGHETYRGELTLMYFLDIDMNDKNLKQIIIIPLRIKNMQLQKVSGEEVKWIRSILDREGKKLNTQTRILDGYRIEVIKRQ